MGEDHLTYFGLGLLALAMLAPGAGRAQEVTPAIQVVGRVAASTHAPDPAEARHDSAPAVMPAWADAAALLEAPSSPRFSPSPSGQPGAMPFVRSEPRGVAPFPIVLNRTIRQYVDDMLAHPGGLVTSFERSRPYFADMVRVLEQNGLPRDLVYLSFAESGFNSSGAGPWQLSKSTARRFGLVVNNFVDERRDPIKSTRAAAEYLATLHDETNDWHVALIGWNKGEGALDGFSSLHGVDYNHLMAYLPRTTSALMNRFMAVAVIAHHAREFGMQAVTFSIPPTYHTVKVQPGVPLKTLADRYGTTVAKLHSLNPALLRDRTPLRVASFDLRVPNSAKAEL
ncbi:MAG TPA: lytic transglycosylase domain-containing protein [Candidatus Binataceae bacterium]|nr:lytic transglycosylase domain-containing protein [Candidatus Binataceae bacterium]